MNVTIKIDCDNAAFTECDDATYETARILRELADKIEGHPHFSPGFELPLRDSNGNDVGSLGVH